jgi:thiamine-phosphate diphosphorylase
MTPRLVVITDPAWDARRIIEVVSEIASALAGDVCVQLRDKREGAEAARERVLLAHELRHVTRGKALFVVNGDVALAKRVGADGVHLGSGLRVADARSHLGGATFWISVATHTDEAVRRAALDGAGAALVSPIFDVPGKGPARGLAALRSARAMAPSLALYALGGVGAANVGACISAGASGVAVIRAIFAAERPIDVARALALRVEVPAASSVPFDRRLL